MAIDQHLDLHGFSKAEAIEKVAESIEIARTQNIRFLTCITGKGLHSNGPPVLRPAVIAYAEENNIKWRPDRRNSGRIKLWLEADADAKADAEASELRTAEESNTICMMALDGFNSGRNSFYLGTDTDVEACNSFYQQPRTYKEPRSCSVLSWCASISVTLLTLLFFLAMFFFLGKFIKLY